MLKNNCLYLFVGLLYVMCFSLHANLAEQLPQVKAYVKQIEHPRLVLGVANTHKLNYYFQSGAPFIENPNDILANVEHELTVLPERTLTFNFNDIKSLQQIAEVLPRTFDIITIDFSSIKFADWNEEHFVHFEKMLKPGGKIIFPLDGDPSHTSYLPANSKDDLFTQSLQTIKQDQRLGLGVPNVATIPKELSGISLSSSEIDEDLKLLKKLPPESFGATEDETDDKIVQIWDLAESIGVGNELLHALTKDILQDDNQLREFAKRRLIARKKSILQDEIADEFYQKHVIPLLTQRLKKVFPDGDIVIKKSLPMPKPHRKEYDGYSLVISKAL